MTIFNIRGGYGSGKTTIVRELMEGHTGYAIEIDRTGRKKPYVEAHILPEFLAIIGGDYRRPELRSAGCDGLTNSREPAASYSAIHGYPGTPGIVERYHGEYYFSGNSNWPEDVLFEGAMISARWGRWEEMAARLYARGERTVWCFLDTPLSVMIERIMARNGGKHPKWAGEYADRVKGCLKKAKAVPHITVAVLNYHHPVEDFMDTFNKYKGRQRAAVHRN